MIILPYSTKILGIIKSKYVKVKSSLRKKQLKIVKEKENKNFSVHAKSKELNGIEFNFFTSYKTQENRLYLYKYRTLYKMGHLQVLSITLPYYFIKVICH